MSVRSVQRTARRPGALAGTALPPLPAAAPAWVRTASLVLLVLVGVAWATLIVVVGSGRGVDALLLDRLRSDLAPFGVAAALGALGGGCLGWALTGRVARSTALLAALGSVPAWVAAASVLSERF